jgi:hypothetical protein
MATKNQIDRVLVLSTGHIPQLTDTAIIEEALHDLRGHGVTDGKEHSGMPATMLFPCGDGFYGYMVWADDGFKTMEISDKHAELVRVIEYANSHDCRWIRFDCDGPVIDELPTFDWSEDIGYWHRAADGKGA